MRRYIATTTFRHEEVQAACQLFSLLLRGGDATALLRSDEIARVVGKFQRMKRRVDADPQPKERCDG